MADALTRLVVDCSVVVKWKISTEDHAAAAEALFVDWEQQVVDVSVPNHFPSEVISAFLRASRRDRIPADEAREAIRDLLALPYIGWYAWPAAETAPGSAGAPAPSATPVGSRLADGTLASRTISARWRCGPALPGWPAPASAGLRVPHTSPPAWPGTSAAPVRRWQPQPWW